MAQTCDQRRRDPRSSDSPRHSDLWLALGVAAAGLYLFGGWATSVRFVAEQIQVRTDGQTIDVEGTYLYRNQAPWPALLRIGIPFPIDGDHPEPFGLAVDEVDDSGRAIRRLSPAVRGADVSLRLRFAPRQERRVRLRYCQLTRVARGRYLLRTTRAWRRPVERASFTLALPSYLDPRDSSYPLTALSQRAGWRRFGFRRTAFWPDRDWQFGWQPRRE